MNRRRVQLIAGVVLTCLLALTRTVHEPLRAARGPVAHPFKAIAFDYFVLFNPDSVVDEVERLRPGQGRALTTVWRTRQFEYTWLRAITGRYVDFSAITRDALVYAAHATDVTLTAAEEARLLAAYRHLAPWPDAAGALRELHAAGVRIITIADFSPAMLRANADHAGWTMLFDALISTDANHTYKPDPRAYRLGAEYLHLDKREVVFAASAAWDAVGAASFGYPTVWVNRFNLPIEELGVRPDRMSTDLSGLLEFVRHGRVESH